MLGYLKQLLNRHEANSAGSARSQDELARLAAAALLVEVSRADLDRDLDERESIIGTLRNHFDLSTKDIDELLDEADAQVESATSLYESTSLLNRVLSDEQKVAVLQGLWRVAFADGVLHPLEEHTIRKISDLLYLPHREFIKARLAAENN